ncbi:MAG: hypothetical protein AB7U81_12270 [Thiohalomonadaceae bacterium]
MPSLETWELASYIVTVVGLPLAIAVFLYEQRKERENEDEEAYQLLSDAYTDFLKLVLDNPDLQLRTRTHISSNLSADQRERMMVLYEILIALFERAYLLAYEEDMSDRKRRRWLSWEDYMREWCGREDFRNALPELLHGEDPDFSRYIMRLAQEEAMNQT